MAKIEDFYRGNTRRIRLTFKDVNGNPIDLTDGTVWFTVKRSISDTDEEAVIQKKITSFPDAENGIAEIKLESSDTNDLAPMKYYYDIQLVDADGNVTTVVEDTFSLKPSITRSK